MKIQIQNLTFKCIIGILDFERIKKQRVIINCSFKYDFKNKDFINYAHIAKDIEKTIKKEKFELIEDALLHLKKILKSKYKIKKLKLNITKPDILDNCQVSVSL